MKMKHTFKLIKKRQSTFPLLLLVLIGVIIAKSSQAFVVSVANPIITSDFETLVENVLLWVLGVSGAVTLLMLVASGIMYITSSGDEQKVSMAKKMFTWTIFGLIIVLSSYAIIVVLSGILT
ncbi:pilin [Patescibacteria group bacterium]|nr:pilin [Patescibacteria group bacterium]